MKRDIDRVMAAVSKAAEHGVGAPIAPGSALNYCIGRDWVQRAVFDPTEKSNPHGYDCYEWTERGAKEWIPPRTMKRATIAWSSGFKDPEERWAVKGRLEGLMPSDGLLIEESHTVPGNYLIHTNNVLSAIQALLEDFEADTFSVVMQD